MSGGRPEPSVSVTSCSGECQFVLGGPFAWSVLEGSAQAGTTRAPSAKVPLVMGPAILYVDDERANLDLFRRCFDEEFSVLKAASGPAAIELLEAGEEVGVLVSDQRMEPMTGIELLTLAAARFPNVRRVLLTAYSDRDLLL